MYRLLIVDDEPYIVDDLFEYFSNLKHLGLDVYKAYSGQYALELFTKAKIDIVISDINMPGISGIELLVEIRKNWPKCKVIFLTGYNDFEYVQNALHNNATSYILKTQGKTEILKVVEQSINEIEKELRDEHLITLATEQIHKAIPLLQQDFITNILEKDKLSIQMINKKFTELDIPLDADKNFLFLLGRVDTWPEEFGSSEKTKLLYTIQTIAGQYIFNYCDALPVVYKRELLLWLIQPKVKLDSEERLILYVKESLTSIQTSCRELLNIPVSFSLSSKTVSWEQAADQFEILNFLLEREFGFGTELLLMDNSLTDADLKFILNSYLERQQNISSLKNLELLGVYLNNGQKDDFFKLFDFVIHSINPNINTSRNLTLEIYHALSHLFLSHLNRWGLTDEIANSYDLYRLNSFNDLCRDIDMHSYFQKLAELIFEKRCRDQKKRTGDAIKQIQQYILEHLHEDLSLIMLADMVYLHPNYLSRLFKRTLDITLSEYINEARINLAKQLLKNSSMKIYEIAAATGHESAAYFTRSFKKQTDLTPQEYRVSIK